MERSELYPEIEPFATGELALDQRHVMYWEQCGKPSGDPVLLLHGGPGTGCSPAQRRFFDPGYYRAVLFDQRGAGRSRPAGEIVDNTTRHLVADIERLRQHLGIERWLVFGGSWGSTLALAYAQKHPEQVSELVLRGIFMLSQFELQWFYQGGASAIFPDHWENYLAAIPVAERGDLIQAFYQRLTSDDRATRVAAARAWSIWEAATSYLHVNEEQLHKWGEEEFAIAVARIECHYFVNRGFFDADGQLLRDAPRIRDIPGVIVHGRYDVVTPIKNAFDLKAAWPETELRIVPDAGHAMSEPGIVHELISATRKFRRAGA